MRCRTCLPSPHDPLRQQPHQFGLFHVGVATVHVRAHATERLADTPFVPRVRVQYSRRGTLSETVTIDDTPPMEQIRDEGVQAVDHFFLFLTGWPCLSSEKLACNSSDNRM